MTWVRVAAALGTLAVLVWSLGTGPFLDGLRAVDSGALAAASGLAVLTTACCAWRWRIVARGLGSELGLRTAVAAYYRSIFLNVTLPGGVLGDVDRAMRHGKDAGDVGRGVRAVVLERTAGQIVVLTVGLVVLVTAPPSQLLPLAMLVLVAAALPNVGGWGPREGVTAWAFAAAGLGPSLGVATAVVFGVMVFVASLPGAVVLVAAWVCRTRPAPWLRRPHLGGLGGPAHLDGAPDA